MELICEFQFNEGDYECEIRKASITQPLTEIKAVLGDHQPGKTNADVIILSIQDTVVHYMPKGFSVIFPELKEIYIKNCQMKKILREDLIGFEALEALHLDENQLTSLPDDLLTNMKKLKEISFENNEIEYMSSKLLKSISSNELEFVDFEKNSRINEFFNSDYSDGINSLENLMQIIDKQCLKPEQGETHEGNKRKSEETKWKLLMTHQKKSFNGFASLRSTGKFSDFDIIVENKTKKIRVHKIVLRTQSEFFADMFEKDENVSEMEFGEFKTDAIEELIRYFYTGELSEETEHLQEIFAIATKLKVPEIKALTEKIIINDLKESNAFKVFNLGHSYGSDELKRAAFKKIKEMFPNRHLAEALTDDLEAVKKIIELKEQMDAIIQKFDVIILN
jgi:BTB/POZ domain/Leucine rich repeat